MPLKANRDLFTTTDPNAQNTNDLQIVEADDTSGRFRLVGAGGTISDEIAGKLKLHERQDELGLEPYDRAKELAELEAKNRRTYADNVGVSRAHQGLPANSTPTFTHPDITQPSAPTNDAGPIEAGPTFAPVEPPAPPVTIDADSKGKSKP